MGRTDDNGSVFVFPFFADAATDSEHVGVDPWPMKNFTALSSVFWKRPGFTRDDQDRRLWCYRCCGYIQRQMQ